MRYDTGLQGTGKDTEEGRQGRINRLDVQRDEHEAKLSKGIMERNDRK